MNGMPSKYKRPIWFQKIFSILFSIFINYYKNTTLLSLFSLQFFNKKSGNYVILMQLFVKNKTKNRKPF